MRALVLCLALVAALAVLCVSPAEAIRSKVGIWPWKVKKEDPNMEQELRKLLVDVATQLINVKANATSASGASCERIVAFKWNPTLDADQIKHQVQGYCQVGAKSPAKKALAPIQNYNTITTLSNAVIKQVRPSDMFLVGLPMSVFHIGASVAANMYLNSLMTTMNKQADLLLFLTGMKEGFQTFPQARTVKELKAYSANAALDFRQRGDCVVEAARPHAMWIGEITRRLHDAFRAEESRNKALQCLKIIGSPYFSYGYVIQYSQFGAMNLPSSSYANATKELREKGLKADSIICDSRSFSCCLNAHGEIAGYGPGLADDVYAITLNSMAHALYSFSQNKTRPSILAKKVQVCSEFVPFDAAALRVEEPVAPATAEPAKAKAELVPMNKVVLEGVPTPHEATPPSSAPATPPSALSPTASPTK